VRTLAALLLLSACGQKVAARASDCDVVRQDPASAEQELSRRYPGQPIKVMETIENCVAPNGDECERFAKITQAIPGMIGTTKGMGEHDLLAICKIIPADVRRCMLPSYNLGHVDACKQALANIRQTAQAEQPEQSEQLPTKPKLCGVVSTLITNDGIWVGAADGKGCFAKRAGGELDLAWLEAAWKPFNVACRPALEIAATGDVPYHEIVAAMDLGRKVGLVDENTATPNELEHQPGSGIAPARCQKVTATGTPKASPPQGEPRSPDVGPGTTRSVEIDLPRADSAARGSTPVIIVTRDEVTFATTQVGHVADLAKGVGTIDELAAALPADPTDHRIIIQANDATPYRLIVRIMDTAKAAGYESVMLVTENK
jgi:biopolymer transport protein ExbD